MRKRLRNTTRNLPWNGMVRVAGVLAGTALLAVISGCRVHVDKGVNGEDKNVQVDTPFGGVHVNTDQTTATDLGLPVYPSAQIVRDNDNEKSADVHLGFGEWELRVKVVNYSTPDSKDKVVAFYKKALARYGDVITCQGNTPVGTPTKTSEGLSCADDKGSGTNVQIGRSDYGSGSNGLELKAGSRRRQHVVGIEDSEGGQTRFHLVALELPEGTEGGAGKSD